MQDQLTQSRLKELLDYDPETGVFRWKVARGGRANKVGAVAGATSGGGYRQICIDYTYHKSHRLAFLWMTGAWPEHEVDHINGVRDDNRWVNLRHATRHENVRNIGPHRANNTSGFIGVSWNKGRGRWSASIGLNSRVRCIGYFPTPELAHAAYLKAKDQLHPTHMRLRNHGR